MCLVMQFGIQQELSRLRLQHFLQNIKVFTVVACVMLQPLRWCCVDCVIQHERDVREE